MCMCGHTSLHRNSGDQALYARPRPDLLRMEIDYGVKRSHDGAEVKVDAVAKYAKGNSKGDKGPRDTPRRERAAAASSNQDDNKLIELVAKLSLHSAFRTRILTAVIFRNYTVAAEHPYVQQMELAGKDFAKTHAEANKQQRAQLPPPHIIIWLRLVETHKPNAAQQVEEYNREMKQETNGEEQLKAKLAREITYFRLQRTYRRESKRIELMIEEGSATWKLWAHMAEQLTREANLEQKEGVAPRGDLERRIQDSLAKRT